jgi:hypothetical protein
LSHRRRTSRGEIEFGFFEGHLFVVVGYWLLQPATLQSGCLSRQPITQTTKQSLGAANKSRRGMNQRKALAFQCRWLIGESGNSLIYMDVGVH